MEILKNFWKNTSKWKIASVVIIAIFALNACSPSKKEKTESKKPIPSEYIQVPSTSYKTKEQVKTEFDQAGLKVKFVVGNFDSKAEKDEEKIVVGTTAPIDNDQSNIKYFDPFKYEYIDNGNLGSFSKKGTELVVVYSDHAYTPKSMQTEKSTNEPQSSSSEEQTKDNTATTSKSSNPDEDKWYTDDSKYATVEPLKKTIEMQMKELGTDDPIYAIVINNLQTYSSEYGEMSVQEIANSVEYKRTGLAIYLSSNGEKVNKDIADKISKDLLNTSGKLYTFY